VAGAAVVPVVLLGGVLGVLAGAAAGLGAKKWLAARQRAAGGSGAAPGDGGRLEDGDGASPQLPLCADLMAACLAAGAAPGEAAEAVGRCLEGPLGAALIRVAAEVRLGADPAECWDRFGRRPGAHAMGRCLGRASATGSAPVAEMSRLAADYRAGHGRSALARARKAAVLATAPLGVCFLPAFLLVGVAPVVLGLAGAFLGGGPP
jgi:pilus assembly protein TadC